MGKGRRLFVGNGGSICQGRLFLWRAAKDGACFLPGEIHPALGNKSSRRTRSRYSTSISQDAEVEIFAPMIALPPYFISFFP